MYHRELILEPREGKRPGIYVFLWLAFDRTIVDDQVTKDRLVFVANSKKEARPPAEEHCRRMQINYRFKENRKEEIV